MTREEIKKAIESGESVWVVFNEYSYKNDSIKEIDWMKVEGVGLRDNYLQYFDGKNLCGHYYELMFKTKAEAEHYLHHANITRTEQLPFLTWEEFLKEIKLKFIACDGVSNMTLYYCDNTIYLVDDEYPEFNTTSWDLTEANFYKAYDECVRLFKGE